MSRLYRIDETVNAMDYTIFNKDEPFKVYCAGPLFNPAECREMGEIADVIDDYCKFSGGVFKSFCPHRDGIEYAGLGRFLTERGCDKVQEIVDRVIFAIDAYQVVTSDLMVINLNGRVADEGACMEMGMAFAISMPVVGFKTDIRSAAFGVDNPMLTMALNLDIVGYLSSIAPMLCQKVGQINPLDGTFISKDSYLSRVISFGRTLSSFKGDELFDFIYDERLALQSGYHTRP